MCMLLYSFWKNIILHILLNSSSPVDTVDEGGGEMKTNEAEGDVDDGSLMKVPVTLKAWMPVSCIYPG